MKTGGFPVDSTMIGYYDPAAQWVLNMGSVYKAKERDSVLTKIKALQLDAEMEVLCGDYILLLGQALTSEECATLTKESKKYGLKVKSFRDKIVLGD